MENLQTMNETGRRASIENHPNLVRTSIIMFMHLGELYSLYQLKIHINENIKHNLLQESSRARMVAMSRVRSEEARIELEIEAAGNDINMIAEIRTKASINAESLFDYASIFQRNINIAVNDSQQSLIANQEVVHSTINAVSRSVQTNASSITMSQAALQRAIDSVLSTTKTHRELKVISAIAEAEVNVFKNAFEDANEKARIAQIACKKKNTDTSCETKIETSTKKSSTSGSNTNS